MEKNLLSDALMTQKQYTSTYNTWAGECDNQNLRNTMMEILKDEHCIQNEIFNIMKNNNMYPTKQATPQEISEAVTQLTQNQPQQR